MTCGHTKEAVARWQALRTSRLGVLQICGLFGCLLLSACFAVVSGCRFKAAGICFIFPHLGFMVCRSFPVPNRVGFSGFPALLLYTIVCTA